MWKRPSPFVQMDVNVASHPLSSFPQRLPRLVGASKAKELFFTGRRVGGTEARELGLADHVVADDQVGAASLASCVLAVCITRAWDLCSRVRRGLSAVATSRLRRQDSELQSRV